MVEKNPIVVKPENLMLTLLGILGAFAVIAGVLFLIGGPTLAALAMLPAALPAGLLLFSWLSYIEDDLKTEPQPELILVRPRH